MERTGDTSLSVRLLFSLRTILPFAEFLFHGNDVPNPLTLLSAFTSSLCQPDPSTRHDQPDPTLPRLPALPHQVLKGVYALAHATPRRGVFEDSQQGQAGGGDDGSEDGDGENVQIAMRREMRPAMGVVFAVWVRVLKESN